MTDRSKRLFLGKKNLLFSKRALPYERFLFLRIQFDLQKGYSKLWCLVTTHIIKGTFRSVWKFLKRKGTAYWIWDSSIVYSIKPKIDIGLFVDLAEFPRFYQFLHDVIIKLFCFDLQNNFMITSYKNW